MKQFNKILVLFVLLSTLSVDNTYSQSFTERIGAESNGYNPLSLRKVHESYGEGLILKRNRINHFR